MSSTATTRIAARQRLAGAAQGASNDALVTFVLVLGGLWVQVSTGVGQPWSRIVTAMGWGIFAFIAMMIARPGAHGNTLISAAASVSRLYGFRLTGLVARFVVQVIMCLLAVFVIWLVFRGQALQAELGAPNQLADVSSWSAFWSAFWTALFFCLYALLVLDRVGSRLLRATFIGFAFGLAVYASMPKAGGGINTAREFYPALLPGADVVWSALIGGLFAAFIAGFIYRWVAVNRTAP
jgi:Major intrinsic protein